MTCFQTATVAFQHAQMQRRILALQRQTVCVLWHVAGNDTARRRRVAQKIGVERLVDYINLPRGVAAPSNLPLVGSEALGALCSGADVGQKLTQAAEYGAVQCLVRLLG